MTERNVIHNLWDFAQAGISALLCSKTTRHAKGAKGYGNMPIVPSVYVYARTWEKGGNRGPPLHPLHVLRLAKPRGGL